MKEDTIPYLHRDISWLSFNYRVLQEAKDPNVPLFEQVKFLAIYSSNLSEFFKVRVANHRNLLRVGKKTKRKLEFEPKEILDDILDIVYSQQKEFSKIFEKQIIPALRKHNIYVLRRTDLNEDQITFVEDYFKDKLLPFVQPVLLQKEKIKPFLNNGALYLAVWLKDNEKNRNKNEYAVVKIPSDHLPRFVELPAPKGRHYIIMLDDIVRHSLDKLFPGYDIEDSFSIKLTRDAELYIDDEFSGDLITKIKNSLNKRNVGPASRFTYDRKMPENLLEVMINNFNLTKYDLIPEGRYQNNFDFFSFPDFGNTHLKNLPLPPIAYSPLEDTKDIFAAIRKKDHLIHLPYHSYKSVVKLFKTASKDPAVTHIKIILYRVGKKSKVMEALMEAVEAGKQVTAFIEVKARFDEEANLEWGEKLEKAGIKVYYSFPGLKVHSKIAIVRRIENKKSKTYAYLSTGNFNEATAKIYSDIGLFTADERLTSEAIKVFSVLEFKKIQHHDFQHLLVGQFNLRPKLTAFIDTEIQHALKGKPAAITLKMNSLQDQEMIEKLYEADQAGVQINLIVRGICSFVPEIKGFSTNTKIISIVDRFLEHARIFIFQNGGNERIFCSSADWMVRNLSYRIETTFPIYDQDIRRQILDYIDMQLQDNVKARIIDPEDTNAYKTTLNDLGFRSQEEIYYYLKRRLDKADE